MADIFISYAREDAPDAVELSKILEEQGHTIFLDDDALETGSSLAPQIRDAIDQSEIVLVLLSKHFTSSSWVQSEIQHALAAKKRVIPVHLDALGKENFVWPLVSDRVGFSLNKDVSLKTVADQVADLTGPAKGPSPLGLGYLSRIAGGD